MCGRYTLTVDASVLATLFDLEPLFEIVPRYNIAPSQSVPIVRTGADRDREWVWARWGLIPPWARDAKIGNKLINARAETAGNKPSFRPAYMNRRCLIPADGFFEWVKTPNGKQPHYIRFADRRAFAFGGLWERWTPPDAEAIESCTILTIRPNEFIASLHDRMPVIIPPGRFSDWIATAPLRADLAEAVLVPHSADGMESVPVKRMVNSPKNDDPRCVEPAGEQGLLEWE